MKLSKYNLYREINDKVLIYNFLSGEFGITDKEKIIERNYDTEEFRKYGFSCQNEEEEDLLAMYKHNKMLHTSELNLTILASENCNFACQYCFDSFNGINIKQSVAAVSYTHLDVYKRQMQGRHCRNLTKNIWIYV